MIKINFNLLQILTMNSLNVKHQGKIASNQLAFHLSAYNHLWKLLKSNISEAYKVQVDSLKDSESNFYDKYDMKEKVNDFVRLYEAMKQEFKTASYSIQIQNLTLVPCKWSQIYCWEYFNVFEYLVWTSHEIKKVGGILSKLASKKMKNYHHWNTSSGNKCLWRWQFQ